MTKKLYYPDLVGYRTLVRAKACPACQSPKGRKCTETRNDVRQDVDYVHDARAWAYDHGKLIAVKAPGEEMMTASQVASLFMVDTKTVTRWAKQKRLTCIKTLGGHRRYKKAEVMRLHTELTSEIKEKNDV